MFKKLILTCSIGLAGTCFAGTSIAEAENLNTGFNPVLEKTYTMNIDKSTGIPSGIETAPFMIVKKVNDKYSISGNSGCNSFSGSLLVEDGKVKAEHLISTRKMCFGDSMQIERNLLNALGQSTPWVIDEDSLSISNTKNTFVFEIK